MNPVLTAFSLTDQESPLVRAFKATGAAIHGGAALSWYLNAPPPPGQDIDIWCQPSEPILKPIIFALYDTIFRAAGYAPYRPTHFRRPRNVSYYNISTAQIDIIYNWYNSNLGRKIQLIIRKSRTRTGTAVPASPIEDFDLDITTLCVAPSILTERLMVYVPSTELARQIDRRVMNIKSLRGQQLRSNLSRIRKYYARGFAFESTEARCTCACGVVHHMLVTPPHRLSLNEAMADVRKQWLSANPLAASDPLRADNLKRTLLLGHSEKQFLTINDVGIRKMLNDCEKATEMPQNAMLYPIDTLWLDDYCRTLRYVCRIRLLKGEVENYETLLKSGTHPNFGSIRPQLALLLARPESESYPALAATIRDLDIRMKAVDEGCKAVKPNKKAPVFVTDTIEHV